MIGPELKYATKFRTRAAADQYIINYRKVLADNVALNLSMGLAAGSAGGMLAVMINATVLAVVTETTMAVMP